MKKREHEGVLPVRSLTNEPHPHVHVIIKAISEQGERLNIRKATLREWREAFASHLRHVGVAANATPRIHPHAQQGRDCRNCTTRPEPTQ